MTLTPKAQELLNLLLEKPGSLVTKDEIMTRLWADTAVEEGNLAFQVSTLRKALQDGPEQPAYIETVPKCGYRFIAEVRSTAAMPSHPVQPSGRSLWGWFAVAGVVVTAALLFALWKRPKSGSDLANSIAVLPFQTIDGNPGNDYFSDGLTEEVINALCRVPGLRVIARTSSFIYKARPWDVREIGKRLAVGLVLEGSVRKQGDRIRVTAQLVETTNGTHLWSQTWDENLNDVFAIQESLSRRIADRVPGNGGWSPPKIKRTDPETYQIYLRGRQAMDELGPQDIRRSITFFDQTIARDPAFAPGYAAGAFARLRLYMWAFEPASQTIARVRSGIEKALELDPDSPEAHMTKAALLHFHDWNHGAAESELRQAIDLAPADSLAHAGYGTILSNLGRVDQSIAEHRHAVSLDPLDPRVKGGLALAFFHARRYHEAVAVCDEILKAQPGFVRAHLIRGLAAAEAGNAQWSVTELDLVIQLAGRALPYQAWRAYVLAAAGRSDESRRALQELETVTARSTVSALLAMVRARLGDQQLALECLKQAIENREAFMAQMDVEPGFDPLRKTGAFQQLRAVVMGPKR